MPIQTTAIAFGIHDAHTLQFMDHCMDNWKDTDACTEAHVAFMKHLMRTIFRLHHAVPLMGIRFEDQTLAMLSPPSYNTFYVLTRSGMEWSAAHVRIAGFVAHWGMETGFWDGLMMAESVLMGAESVGPAEEEV